MAEVKVAVLGASGRMGKVQTMACQTFPHFPGTAGGTAKVVAAEAIRSITTGQQMWPAFETGHHIRQIVDARMESSPLGRWVLIA